MGTRVRKRKYERQRKKEENVKEHSQGKGREEEKDRGEESVRKKREGIEKTKGWGRERNRVCILSSAYTYTQLYCKIFYELKKGNT